eukprot:5740259-Amphidinium_carterae.2
MGLSLAEVFQSLPPGVSFLMAVVSSLDGCLPPRGVSMMAAVVSRGCSSLTVEETILPITSECVCSKETILPSLSKRPFFQSPLNVRAQRSAGTKHCTYKGSNGPSVLGPSIFWPCGSSCCCFALLFS